VNGHLSLKVVEKDVVYVLNMYTSKFFFERFK